MTGYPQVNFNPYSMYQNWGYGYQYPSFRGVQNVPQPVSVPQPNVNLQTPPDTVSFRATEHIQAKPKKEVLSTGAKWGIGLGLTALAAGGIYLLSKGRVGAKQTRQLAEHIDFKPAKTVKEAKKFAQEKLGVAVDGELSLDVLNFANEGLCTLRNKSPKTFSIKWIESSPIGGGYDSGALAQIVHSKSKNCYGINFSSDYIKHLDDSLSDFIQGELERGAIISINGKLKYQEFFAKADISSDIIALANKFKENPAQLNFRDKIRLHMGLGDIGETMDRLWVECSGDISKLTKTIKVNSSPFHSIYHEQGHALHRMNISEKFAKLDKLDILKANNIDTTLTEEFIKSYKDTALKVSDYASESPLEFVAEVYAKCLNGQTFSDDVMALYKKYGGPEIT